MKLVEFTDLNIDNKETIPYDVVDDLHFHMRNDRMFYRKQLLPVLVKLSQSTDLNVNEILDPVIDLGVDHYCKKYNLPSKYRSLINDDDKTEVRSRILQNDVPAVKQGKE